MQQSQEPRSAEPRVLRLEPNRAQPIGRLAILTGGADRPYALGLAASLIAQGVTFDFIGSDYVDGPELHSQPLVRFLNLRGEQNPNANMLKKIWRILTYYGRLISYAATSDAKLFHILWNNKIEWFDRTLLLLGYRLLGKKLVMTAHNVNARRRDGNDTWLNRQTLGIQYRLTHHIFVHTEKMKEELIKDFRIGSSKVSVIPFGLNSTVPDTALTPSEARRRLKLEDGAKVMLFFGNIAPYKGLEYLVDAFARVASSQPELRLVIAGRPKGHADYWEGIKRKISEHNLEPRVLQRIEYITDEETEVFFKASDVLVLPYNHVFQSGVLFLGYNFGLPVIATDVGSLKDDILEGETGLVCQAQDASDLAQRLEMFFRSGLYGELSTRRAKIKQFAQDRYSWAKVAEITTKVYRNLFAKKQWGTVDVNEDRVPS